MSGARFPLRRRHRYWLGDREPGRLVPGCRVVAVNGGHCALGAPALTSGSSASCRSRETSLFLTASTSAIHPSGPWGNDRAPPFAALERTFSRSAKDGWLADLADASSGYFSPTQADDALKASRRALTRLFRSATCFSVMPDFP
jgi:hypothetical protein